MLNVDRLNLTALERSFKTPSLETSTSTTSRRCRYPRCCFSRNVSPRREALLVRSLRRSLLERAARLTFVLRRFAGPLPFHLPHLVSSALVISVSTSTPLQLLHLDSLPHRFFQTMAISLRHDPTSTWTTKIPTTRTREARLLLKV